MSDGLLAVVTRGGAVEGRHYGAVVAADTKGVLWSNAAPATAPSSFT